MTPGGTVAFLQIAEQDGRSVADVVGAQGLRSGSSPAAELTALGYPVAGRVRRHHAASLPHR